MNPSPSTRPSTYGRSVRVVGHYTAGGGEDENIDVQRGDGGGFVAVYAGGFEAVYVGGFVAVYAGGFVAVYAGGFVAVHAVDDGLVTAVAGSGGRPLRQSGAHRAEAAHVDCAAVFQDCFQ